MSWLTEIPDTAALRDRAVRNLAMPLGLANPLWLAFGAAASAGAAWWLMTRWATPFNIEAHPAATTPPAPAVVESPVAIEATVGPVAEAVETAVADSIEAESERFEAVIAGTDAMVTEIADDLTRLAGVGPKTAAALMERGVTRFADLAAWSEEQIADFDAEMKLKGRSVRDAWQAQAEQLASEA